MVGSLRYIRLKYHFISIIWHCISSSIMNILWNGEYTGEFTPKRGIHQGYPLSPYLFVIYIERLSHLIQMLVEQNHGKPVSISRSGPLITHLCFADNLFIFTKASMHQVEVIKHCLDVLRIVLVKG